MVEQAAVNREVVGSSPTEAVSNLCRVDELVKSPVSETGNCRFDSYLGSDGKYANR